MSQLEAIILGCGSSGGVPRANGDWGACDPNEPRNRRRRCSLLVRRGEEPEATTVLVDTSPDLRAQVLDAGVKHIDAVLYTHDHADQAHGIDDLRAFAMTARRRIPAYMDPVTRQTLERRFHYIFEGEKGYPALCDPWTLPGWGVPWAVEGKGGPVHVTTFEQEHGPISSVGYRFGGLAYSSDVSELSEAALNAVRGCEVWIVDALRMTPHPTHAHLERTLHWIQDVKPERAILTNLHLDMDYRELSAILPDGVEAAYDGMRVLFSA
ncbi:MBL fold metallo-hydrolase [Brevundimonas sp. 2R-24]|uniref:MBL fold metallo-hydrolase n=1 Tax=Peiella sedimenti TaxID=3061083 RepID=A0ABT8SJE1_9CAUL|nr:MBL fold metallo-hydrolase [Caulobacteraceae bacterium XZ-24]